METSLRSSTIVPPIPKVMTFPNDGSILPPTRISRPGGHSSSTMTPVRTAPGTFSPRDREICRNASCACESVFIPVITPPTSLLWITWGEITFITTGNPSEDASAPASSAECATPCPGTGIPAFSRSSIPSSSVRRTGLPGSGFSALTLFLPMSPRFFSSPVISLL
ncbi:MAG: hypothetical protein A4E38_00580 [Methanoregulaceae archaeon PtaB.Bin108]|nr:MAG: hypothetical protein A4E38_00580 [Methanoregulaceae archaeon PtaB.Bin108]